MILERVSPRQDGRIAVESTICIPMSAAKFTCRPPQVLSMSQVRVRLVVSHTGHGELPALLAHSETGEGEHTTVVKEGAALLPTQRSRSFQ